MQTTTRLPRILQRISEIGIAITVVITLIVLLALVLTDSALDTSMEFTPDEGTYSLSSDTWGTGTIGESVGVVTFTDGNATFVVLAAAEILAYTAVSLSILFLLRAVLKTLSDRTPFVEANVHRIRVIGVLIPVFGILIQGLDWAASLVAMDTVAAEGLHIEARLSINLTYLFIGLVVIALAEAFRYGSVLQTDADLTV